MHHLYTTATIVFRRLKRSLIAVPGIFLLLSGPSSAQQNGRILVGPNILVSRDMDGNAWETMIAADPSNPERLLGTSIVGLTNSATNAVDTRGYISRDGGNT